MPAHCVRVRFPFSAPDLTPIFELEDALIEAIEAADAGEFDGNDVGQGECILYMYGPDADALFQAIQPALTEHRALVAGGQTLLRYGPPEDGIREVAVPIPNT